MCDPREAGDDYAKGYSACAQDSGSLGGSWLRLSEGMGFNLNPAARSGLAEFFGVWAWSRGCGVTLIFGFDVATMLAA